MNDKNRDHQRPPDECLAEAILRLACSINGMAEQLSLAVNNQILSRIEQKVDTIMSKISDFAAAQTSFNVRQGTAIDSAVASLGGLTGDVSELNRIITELQNSSGGVTPEDQALLDELQTAGEAAAAKSESLATALKVLDDATPPAVPPVLPA